MQMIEGFQLSVQQRRLWSLLQTDSELPYRACAAVQISGPLDQAALDQALNEVIARHEILRTTFHVMPGMSIPLQVIGDGAFRWSARHDLEAEPEQPQRIEALWQALQQQPLDLENGPPLQATLITLAPEQHVMLLTIAALCADASTVQHLVRELSQCYAAHSAADDEPLQYADFANWQSEELTADDAARAYWRKFDLQTIETLRLPFEQPAASDAFAPATLRWQFTAEQSAQIDRLVRQYDTSSATFWLACWAILLSRLSEQADLVIGVGCDGRGYEELESALGLFAAYAPLRCRVNGDTTVAALITEIGAAWNELTEWQESFSWDHLAGSTEQSFFPFCFDFVAQPAPTTSGLVSFALTRQATSIERCAVRLSCAEQRDGHAITIQYDTKRYAAAEMQRLLERLQTLISAVIEQPDSAIGALALLGDDERRQLIDTLSATEQRDLPTVCVHHLFEQQAARTPDAIAARFATEQMRYAELNNRANRLAQQLQQLGVGPDVLVGVCMERSLDLLIGLLAILKAGGAYVPLDPDYPEERIQFMIADAQMPVILTDERIATRLDLARRHPSTRVLPLDAGASDDSDVANITSAATADNLAYVIYTSGSTGRPKGVAIAHRGLVNYLSWATQAYAVAEGQGAPVHSSISFDLTITGLFTPLLTGRTVELLPEELGIEALGTALREHDHFSLVKITPAHLAMLAQQIAPEQAAERTHAFIIGGEQLLAEPLRFWQFNAPTTRLINEYGPTETVVGCCVYELPADARLSSAVPIGRPIANTRLYVLDQTQRLALFGVTGELYIGGAGVARGYLGRPALTAERFIPDPFSDEPGARLYRTGDLARYQADGNLEYLGRIDDQVKLRGFRIELGEIETVLAQHPAVHEAAVVARPDASGEQRLVAYVVGGAEPRTKNQEPGDGNREPGSRNKGTKEQGNNGDGVAHSGENEEPADTIDGSQFLVLGSSDLRAFLAERLPSYMLPAAFVPVAALPLTANGKLNRAALAKLDPAQSDPRARLRSPFVAPRSPIEQTLATIWADTLGVAQVGIHDSFFALGGDSILSFRMIFQATQAGIRLTLKQLFDHPTIAELAPLADATGGSIDAEQSIVSGDVPLTPIQRWLFEQELPAPHHFNQSVLLATPPDLDPQILRAALDQLLTHHDALRLRFTHAADGWKQHNAAADDAVSLVVHELADDEPTQQQARLAAIADEMQASLDLADGPLVRVALLRYGAQVADRLLIVVHHLAIDGVSWRILLDDLQTLLRQLQRGETAQLAPKTTSFKRWAERLQAYAQTTELQQQRDYWLSAQRTQAASVPREHADGTNTVASAEHVAVALTAAETRALLQDVPTANGVQINAVLLTALTQSLGRWSDGVPLVDLEAHGREDLFDDIDVSRTVGWFTAIYPLLLAIRPNDAPLIALAAIHEQLRAVPQRGVGYGLLRYLGADRQLAEQLAALPQAEISFNYLGQLDQALVDDGLFAPAGEPSGAWRDPRGPRRYLLDINSSVTGGQLTVSWQYSRHIHQRATIEAVAQQFVAALRAMIAASQVAQPAPAAEPVGQPALPEPSSLVALQAEGQRQPFFCVHASGGIVFVYNELAQLLAAEQPFYGLQSHGLYPDQQPDTAIEAMAARYVAALRAAQPHGPYQLGGWSGGAVIAFEMAQQLRAAGDEVALLALIDQPPPDPQAATPDEATLLLNLLGINFPDTIEQVRQLAPEQQIVYALEQAKAARLLPPSIGIAEVRHFLRIYRINSEALRAYTPQRYAGRITLFRATDQPPNALDPDGALGWRELADEITIHPITGDHYSMVRTPHVHQLAQALQRSLDRAQHTSEGEQQRERGQSA